MDASTKRAGEVAREDQVYDHFKSRRLDCLASEVPLSLRATKYDLYFHLAPPMLAGGEMAGAVLMHLSHAATLDHFIYHCDSSALTISQVYLAREPLSDNIHWKVLLDPDLRKALGFVLHPPELRKEGLGPDGHTVLCFFPSTETESFDAIDECSTSDSVSEVLIDSAVLFIFKSNILEVAEGLYLDASSEGGGEPSLQTALEQLFARRVFPCIDLPVMKAQFVAHFFLWKEDQHQVHTTSASDSVTPLSGDEQEVVCQTLRVASRPQSQLMLQTYSPTIDMPPYSFSFLYGDFLPSRCNASGGFDLTLLLPTRRLKSLTNLQDSTQVVMRWSSLALNFFRDDFFHQVELLRPTLSKLLLIPLQTQRGLGLENHGVITLKDDFCLASAKDAKISRLARVARLVIHEICHQWVGNRFTPAEITDIWLKEGFTRFLEFVVLGHLLRGEDDSLASEYIANIFFYDIKLDSLLVDSMDANALIGTECDNHPIQPPQARLRRNDLMSLFDSITYNKAAAVLAMWDSAWASCRLDTKIFSSRPSSATHCDRFIQIENSIWCEALQESLKQNTTGLLRWKSICEAADLVRSKPQPPTYMLKENPICSIALEPASGLPRVSTKSVEELLTPWLREMGHPHVRWTCKASADGSVILHLHQSSSQVPLADCWEEKSLEPRCSSLCRQYASLWTIPLCIEITAASLQSGEQLYVHEFVLMSTQEFSIKMSPLNPAVWTISDVNVIDPAGWLGLCVLARPSDDGVWGWERSPLTQVWHAISRGFSLAVAMSCRKSLISISIRNMFQPKQRSVESRRRLALVDPNFLHPEAHESDRNNEPLHERRCDDEFEVHATVLAGPEPPARALEKWYSHLCAAANAQKEGAGQLTRAILRHLIMLQERKATSEIDFSEVTKRLRASFSGETDDSDNDESRSVDSCVNPLWSVGITGGLPAAFQQVAETLT